MDCKTIFKKLNRLEVIEFIRQNLKTDVNQLILKGSPFPDIDIKDLATQIQGRQKAEKKLPTWFANDHIVYPPVLNLSQTSSEATADYKSRLIAGETLIDITGGLGIDDFYFSHRFQNVTHCEINASLSEIAQYNLEQILERKNIQFIHQDGIAHLTDLEKPVDWIYADPGRRSETGKKLFKLEETQPNILEHLPLFFEKSKGILIKTSPLFDIQAGIKCLQHIESIHVVAYKNEVKELLWVLKKESNSPIKIHSVNLKENEPPETFSSLWDEGSEIDVKYSPPLQYLYEPNAAILKAGFFKEIAHQFNLFKIGKNSHLYTGNEKIDFPGRVFKIRQTISPSKKEIKKLSLDKANITTRNFPMSIAEIRKKFKLKDGGKDYLFFTQGQAGKKILIWGIKA